VQIPLITYESTGAPSYEWTYEVFIRRGVRLKELSSILEWSHEAACLLVWYHGLQYGRQRQRTRSEFTRVDGVRLRQIYSEDLWRIEDVISELGLRDPQEMYNWLQLFNIPRRRRQVLLQVSDDEWIAAAESDMTVSEICRQFGVTADYLYRQWRRLGIRSLDQRRKAVQEFREVATYDLLYKWVHVHGFSPRELASKFGIAVSTVSRHMKLLGVPRNTQDTYRPRGGSTVHADTLRYWYVTERRTLEWIADKVGGEPSGVYRALVRLGIIE